jgi:signal transduction histidine kinase/HPt (histidine-containing phosphotransfer) domain-containing protein/ActR/RegA family two-component response regulator
MTTMRDMTSTIAPYLKQPTLWKRAGAALLLAGALGAAIQWVGQREEQRALATLESRLLGRSAVSASLLAQQIGTLERDVLFLASLPPVGGIVRASGNGGYDAQETTPIALWHRRLISIFTAYAATNADILQVALTGVADQGRELARIDRNDDAIVAVTTDRLRQTATLGYMQATAGLPAGQVYVSDIAPERAPGQGAGPGMPVLRAATPIYDGRGKLFGAIVVSYAARAILTPPSANLPPDLQAYLTDGQGAYLLHPDDAKTFGADHARRLRWQDEFRPLAGNGTRQPGRYQGPDGPVAVALRRVSIDSRHPQRDLTLAMATALAPATAARQSAQLTLLTALISGAVLVGGASQLLRRQRRRLDQYRAAATARIEQLNVSLEQQVRERTRQIESVTILQRAILAHASYAIIATGTDGIIRLFNPAAERMLGYGADELLGKCTPERLHERAEVAARAAALSQELGCDIAPGFEVFVAKARLGIPNESAYTYVRKDGSTFPVMLSVSALREDSGAIIGFLGIASDISTREQDRRTLVAARDQLLNASKVAELGIWTWAPASDTVEWNERMFDFYDVPKEQRDQPYYADWQARLHPEDRPRVAAGLRAAAAGSQQHQSTFRIVCRDGALRYMQAATSHERDGQGQVVRVLGINRDITSQHEAEQTLRAAMTAADAANRAKSEFLANMSHEIRSPLNAVLGMLTLLKQTPLDARQLDYADKCEGAGRALLGILNDILDFSRVEAGKLTLDPHAFSIRQLFHEVDIILSAAVGARAIALRYELADDLPPWVVGDALRLQQVLLNLGGNAIKFTHHGEVAIAVSVAPARDGGPGAPAAPTLRFAVRDTGIGIAPDQLERIFDGFSQAEASTARRYGGSGLGLAICRRLVQMMGGTLEVASVEGAGSTFRFALPLQPAMAPAQAVPALPGAAWAPPGPAGAHGAAPAQLTDGATLAGLRLLLVEDNPINQQVARELLQHAGASVEVADHGQAALDTLQSGGQYDCVLMDVQMPLMDGYEATRQIRTRLGMHGLPIIAMTANAMQSDRAQAFQAGMNDHVGKPFDLPQLLATIVHHTGRAPGGTGPAPGAALPLLHVPPALGINGAAALARFNGNAPVYQRALQRFTTECGSLAAAVPEALDSADAAAAAAKHLHGLKGLAATVGADALAALAQSMELLLRSQASAMDWQMEHARLIAEARRAASAGAELAGHLAEHLAAFTGPPAGGAGADPAALPGELARLQRLLEASSLDALPLFDRLLRDYGAAMQPEAAGLEAAMETFDLALAAQLCRGLLRRLDAHPDPGKHHSGHAQALS